MSFAFVKGHGTHNDFVVLPDLDGTIHGDLDADRVRALCDRRGGIGGDGVLRVLRASNSEAPWFMDYRNADGSVAEMCGNGVRVFARYLAVAGLIDPADALVIDSRDGVRRVEFCDDGEISVEMGLVRIGEQVKISVDGRAYVATAADAGNPHAVAIVESLDEAGELRVSPEFATADFPSGVNIEFVRRLAPGHIAMRVFERGVGETMSCGTGACAVAAVIAAVDEAPESPAYRIDVPGGTLTATVGEAGQVTLKGDAVLVAEGTWLG